MVNDQGNDQHVTPRRVQLSRKPRVAETSRFGGRRLQLVPVWA
jgi:hypothetical protein